MTFLRFARARTLCVWLLIAVVQSAIVSAANTNNILLIIADDYGADSYALWNTNAGVSLPPTPNLNTLASRGVFFRNAYAQPLCSPTRACILTGRYPFRTGIGYAIGGAGSAVLQASEVTLPEHLLANSSLQMAQFGKWHLAQAPNSPATLGGWPHFAGTLQGALTNYYTWTKTVNGVNTFSYSAYATTDVVNDAIAWIQARGAQPWFAWVAFNAGHVPLHKPPSALCPTYAGLPGTQADINGRPRLYFEAMIEAMDTEIGRLLAAVNRTNTHILFLGDNGTQGNIIQPNFPASRGKGTLYEGGIRVPMIIAGPAVKVVHTNDTLVEASDLFATIVSLAGAPPASTGVDAHSLLPLLNGTVDTSRTVLAEVFGGGTTPANSGRSLRDTRYKLTEFNDGVREFYDLQTDPYESTNLLAGTMSAGQQAAYYQLRMQIAAYQDTLVSPVISSWSRTAGQFAVTVQHGAGYTSTLWQASDLSGLTWAPVTNALVTTNSSTSTTLVDPAVTNVSAWYRVETVAP